MGVKFMTTVGSTNLEDHFLIPGKYNWEQKAYDEYQLDVRREYTVVPPLDLPDDVCKYIAEFLHIHMNASFRIKYTSAFTAPQWYLRECTTNLFINLEGTLMIHNKAYMQEWSPALTLESDMLHLILAILPVLRNGSK